MTNMPILDPHNRAPDLVGPTVKELRTAVARKDREQPGTDEELLAAIDRLVLAHGGDREYEHAAVEDLFAQMLRDTHPKSFARRNELAEKWWWA